MPAIDLHQHLWPGAVRRAAARPHACAVPARLDAAHRRASRPYDARPGRPRRRPADRAGRATPGSGWPASASPRRSASSALPRDEAARAASTPGITVRAELPGHFARLGLGPQPWTPTSTGAGRAPGRAASSACSCRPTSLRQPGRRGWRVGEVLRVGGARRQARCSSTRARADRTAGAVPVVGAGRRLRRPDAGGLVGMARLRRSLALPATCGWSSRPVPGWRPLQHERLAARGGPASDRSTRTSSSTPPPTARRRSTPGPRARHRRDSCWAATGPYAEPLSHLSATPRPRLVRVDNPRRALGPRLDVPTLEAVA